MLMYRMNYFFIGMSTTNMQHIRTGFFNNICFGTQATCDNNASIFSHCFLNGIQGFFDRTINKTTGINNHNTCILITGNQLISLSTQLRNDSFRINKALGQPKLTKPTL